MAVSSQFKCADCGSKELSLQVIDRIRGMVIKGFPIARCSDCGSIALSDIGIEVYRYCDGTAIRNPNSDYESLCDKALREPPSRPEVDISEILGF